MSKVGIVFALFVAMAFLLMAMGSLFFTRFSPFSVVSLVATLVLGAYLARLMLKV